MKVTLLVIGCLILLVVLNGCGFVQRFGQEVTVKRFMGDKAVVKVIKEPGLRMGCTATATLGTKFLGVEDLKIHRYGGGLLRGNGVVYTCEGGHIDIGHVKETADRTRFLSEVVFEHLMNGDRSFAFRLSRTL